MIFASPPSLGNRRARKARGLALHNSFQPLAEKYARLLDRLFLDALLPNASKRNSSGAFRNRADEQEKWRAAELANLPPPSSAGEQGTSIAESEIVIKRELLSWS
jgi:hypothetical protein